MSAMHHDSSADLNVVKSKLKDILEDSMKGTEMIQLEIPELMEDDVQLLHIEHTLVYHLMNLLLKEWKGCDSFMTVRCTDAWVSSYSFCNTHPATPS
ncbi:hypothetical protein L195_g009025 [Trifolium pratense]|uniref:Uncharacterized protein n=1 Tax=Trifolium pratense TaxID=57577 RepID=A0A2K3PAU7_TRIPR|nr:hypothetical protein L195_g009025 [Trifolium pratense]